MPGLQTTPPERADRAVADLGARSRGSQSASFAAPASASRRLSIGVEPACAAWPRQVIARALDAERAEHDAERQVHRLEHRPLLDVQLEVGAPRSRAAQRASSARSRSTPCARSASGSAMPSRSVSFAQLVLVAHRARRGRRAEERAAEARALLVGPVDEPHRDRRLALLGDPAQHLDAGEHVQAAVEPAAVRHRVDVPADQQRALGRARAA